jgi:nuclear cap-binding protein subunit 1
VNFDVCISGSFIAVFLARYLSSLVTVNANPQNRAQTVKIIVNFWQYNEQFLAILLDKLVAYRILDNLTVVNWLFTDVIPNANFPLFAWEILTNTVTKITGRTQQIQARIKKEESEHKKREEERFRERKFHSNSTEFMEREKQMDMEKQAELERIKALNNNLGYALREEKEVFLLVFQKFVDVLNHRLLSVSSSDDPWFWRILGHLREFGRKHYRELRQFMVTLETLLFTPNTDGRILAVFEEFRVLNTA